MGTSRITDRPPSRAEVERWCRDFEACCRARGLRVTAQRLAVYRALAMDRSHPTAEAVHGRVRAAMPMLSQATVYRILESLEQEQLVRRVSTTGGIARFDANLSPHQHLVCRVCGRMVDHFGPSLAATAVPSGAVDGFVVEELDIRMVGHCVTCRPPTPGVTGSHARRSAAPPHSRSLMNSRKRK